MSWLTDFIRKNKSQINQMAADFLTEKLGPDYKQRWDMIRITAKRVKADIDNKDAVALINDASELLVLLGVD